MPTYTPLQSIQLTEATSSVTFSGIPQTYQDLVLVANIKGTSALDFKITFNGDTSSNYSNTYLTGTGSAAASGRRTSQTYFQPENNGYVTTALEQNTIIHFMNYSNITTYKTALSRSNNASTGLDAFVNLWRSTSAITSIEIGAISTPKFDSGTTLDLYGISPVAAQNAQAFGGTDIYYDSTYVYHVFKGSGTFTPYRNLTADVLVVAGGGGGGLSRGGGGGAGDVRGFASQSLTASTSYTVTVGAGGSGGYNTTVNAFNGSNSQFGSTTAATGGGGGGSSTNNGSSGGSGGGGAATSGGSGTGAAASGLGSAGGNGAAGGGAGSGGGGGGMGGAGSNASSSSTGGNGGAGVNSNGTFTDLSTTLTVTGLGVAGYLAGGGGGASQSGSASTGGSGGGGAGGQGDGGVGTPGTIHTGSGAGGSSYNTDVTRAGGSGIVIVRYAR